MPVCLAYSILCLSVLACRLGKENEVASCGWKGILHSPARGELPLEAEVSSTGPSLVCPHAVTASRAQAPTLPACSNADEQRDVKAGSGC